MPYPDKRECGEMCQTNHAKEYIPVKDGIVYCYCTRLAKHSGPHYFEMCITRENRLAEYGDYVDEGKRA